jgi:VPDSG-CTERM motif
MRTLTRLSLITACLLCPVGVLEAGPVVDISNDPMYSWTWGQDLTLGYSFSVDGSLTFNALAVFDVISATPGSAGHTNAPGLTQDHRVGVWDASGNLLASTTVVPGDPTTSSANTYGTWVYKVLASPVTLQSGTYTIGAFYAGASDPVMVQQSTLTVSGVTYINGRYLYSSTFACPTGTYSPNEQQYFGPTMLSVPDGGTTLILLGSALAGLTMARRRMFRG